ncbi:uroporphyrinogen-III synthase [Neobacillus citreus]|uniref:Uroporphyrinogen-III synthase n=1 Tax=Neobacillus citreus TaxID=2833578 RepID=A0A942SU89_9BACI|nr:uroporphyrinogen-III synthase [Neobacillus citreus]MCH6266305.1 uroporphyrinogen-III synthase [Neobacillus citreus]
MNEKGLRGKKIIICGSRKIEEISTIIEKQGGIPIVRPLQGTVFLAEKEVESDLVKFVKNGADWVILTTGIGTETLVSLAAKLGLEELFLKRLREAKVAVRGYKTISALKKLAVQPVATAEDGTTKGLALALESYDFSNKKIMIQLHGELAPTLTSFFESRGGSVQKILPYQHIAPEQEMVEKLSQELMTTECDAVCFTTATQVHSLFDYAREHNIFDFIVQSLNKNVVAAAVGKVTAEALREEGVNRLVVPENERMGAMIIELAKYFNA